MKYPSFLTSPEANFIPLSGIADGNVEGSKIGIRVLDWICCSAGVKTRAGPFVCPIAAFDPSSTRKQPARRKVDTRFTMRSIAGARYVGITQIISRHGPAQKPNSIAVAAWSLPGAGGDG